MSTITQTRDDQPYRKRSAVLSAVLWVGLVLLFLLPLFSYQDPPPGQEGTLVRLGRLEAGVQSTDAGAAAEVADEPQPEAEVEPTPAEEPVQPEEAVVPPPPAPVEEVAEETAPPPPQPDPEVIRQREAAAVALRERREAEERTRAREAEQRRLAEAKERARAEAEAAERRAAEEARRAAEAAAKRKADQEARAAALRASTGDLFSGSGSGQGGGSGGNAGEQGAPDGDPADGRRTGIPSGAGSIGGGLEGRGVLSSPKISDRSQQAGKVVIEVCVGPAGNVTSAKYTQRGSTTSAETLKALARSNALRYKFAPSSASEQCGKITYEFVVE